MFIAYCSVQSFRPCTFSSSIPAACLKAHIAHVLFGSTWNWWMTTYSYHPFSQARVVVTCLIQKQYTNRVSYWFGDLTFLFEPFILQNEIIMQETTSMKLIMEKSKQKLDPPFSKSLILACFVYSRISFHAFLGSWSQCYTQLWL